MFHHLLSSANGPEIKTRRRRPRGSKRSLFSLPSPMSPQTRSKTQPTAAQPKPTRGLLALTNELLLEIIVHLEREPPVVTQPRVFFDLGYDRRRSRTLSALAQTCGRLRSVFLKLAMEHVEVVCSGKKGTGNEGVPIHVAPYIRCASRHTFRIFAPADASPGRTVSIELSSERMFSEFGRCLACLPHLKALRIPSMPHPPSRKCDRAAASNPCCQYAIGDRPSDAFSRMLQGHSFDSIRTLNIHFRAFSLVKCCPNVEWLGVYGEWNEVSREKDGLRLEVMISDLKNYATMLRVFRCNFFKFFPRSIGVLQFFSNLEEIPDIDVQYVTPDLVQELEIMENLRRITFYQGPWMGQHQLGLGTLQLVQTAKEVLRRTAIDVSTEQKCVLVDVGEEVPPIVFSVDQEERGKSGCAVDQCTACFAEAHCDSS
ncbi:hypothetical protein C8F01DRAFT_1141109 [Mycena amicta]|nr:hypothetical protein C8F01DRAFT_1141109 [Mycena amicta]